MKSHVKELRKSLNNGKTVRRKNVGRHVFGPLWFVTCAYSGYEDHMIEYQKSYDKYSSEVHRDGYWMYKAPNWYFKETVTIPERRKANGLLQKLRHTLPENYDNLIFPDGRKIHRGYW